jgi:serine protease
MGPVLSAAVSGLPSDGRTLFVRLHSMIGGSWQFNDYTVTALSTGSAQRAQLTSPTPGSSLTSSIVTFQWTAGLNVTSYWLYVGNAPGTFDLVNQDLGPNQSTTAFGLPTDGRTLYVRLFSMINGTWQFNDYILTAAPDATAFLFPGEMTGTCICSADQEARVPA